MEKTNTVYFGSESFSSLRLKIWKLVPDTTKNEKSISSFKNQIKTWTTYKRPSRICETYNSQKEFT